MFRVSILLTFLFTIFGGTVAIGQQSIIDTVNKTTPGVHRIITHKYPYKGKKIQLKKGRKTNELVFHPNGVIKERILNDVLYEYDLRGNILKATFQVPELINGNFTKYWLWEYEFDANGATKKYSIARSKYGKTFAIFRYDSVVVLTDPKLDGAFENTITARIIYHHFAPFDTAPTQSEFRYVQGQLVEHRDASEGSYTIRKFSYDEKGNVVEVQLLDEKHTLICSERYEYEQNRRINKEAEANGKSTSSSYSYDENGRLEREIIHHPNGKPQAEIIYTYELY